jgi:hypothetical protein
VSPTVTEIEPLHFSVRLFSLVEVVTIFSPRRYSGRCFSASEPAALDFAIFGFLAANSASALPWSSETVWSNASRVSEESHSGLASQPPRRISKGEIHKNVGRWRRYGIKVRYAPRGSIAHRATGSKKHCSKWTRRTASIFSLHENKTLRKATPSHARTAGAVRSRERPVNVGVAFKGTQRRELRSRFLPSIEEKTLLLK